MANGNIPYRYDIDVMELISVEKVMDEECLGPNGALLRCMEKVEEKIEWLLEKLEIYGGNDNHFIFDLPGQVELFTCHDSLLNIIRILSKRNFRFVVVHLIDASCCIDSMKYISMLLITLKSMMQLECSQINVLSKVDLIEQFDSLPLRLEFYTDVQELRHLFADLGEEGVGGKKYKRLNEAICELVEETNLISFVPLAVEDKECMTFLLSEIDKANGYIFGSLTPGNESIFQISMTQANRDHIMELVKERYMARSLFIDDTEKENE